MSKRTQTIVAILVILFLGSLFQYNYINEFPSHIHAWAQSDRYALAKGFENNGLNFFKPETYVINHQFPDELNNPSNSTITAVDFPIHDFIPAVFMKITGVDAPWIFRLYILLYSFIGLFFLFKLSVLWTQDFIKSFIVLIFAATSPVFVYYQSGFLPTIPSLANAIIGIYYYSVYLRSNQNSHFNLSMLFLTLSVLSRTTFAIQLIAVLTLEMIRITRKKAVLKIKIVPVIASGGVILAYYFYNSILRHQYGSIFLNDLIPAKDLAGIKGILNAVSEKWLTQYFSSIHYIVFAVLIIAALIVLVSKKSISSKNNIIVIYLTGIMFIGCLIFSFLMLEQFRNHDYYFLDTFYLPLLFLLIIVLSVTPKFKWRIQKYLFSALMVIISVPMILNARSSQIERRITGPWDRTSKTIENFKGSQDLLALSNISKDARMLVLDAYAPNLPFILMDRKGYAVITTSKENIEEALTWDFDYIVIQNDLFESYVYANYPYIISRIEKIADNEKISICILSDESNNQTLLEFMNSAK